MVSTTGQDSAWYVLDDNLAPQPTKMPPEVKLVVDRIGENCEPALCTVMFMAGAGGSLRAGVTINPVHLTRSVRASETQVTCGGAPVFVWPGGGITLLVDVNQMPDNSFGWVPTPALVAPIEFTVRRDLYERIGGYSDKVKNIHDVISELGNIRSVPWRENHPWPPEGMARKDKV